MQLLLIPIMDALDVKSILIYSYVCVYVWGGQLVSVGWGDCVFFILCILLNYIHDHVYFLFFACFYFSFRFAWCRYNFPKFTKASVCVCV